MSLRTASVSVFSAHDLTLMGLILMRGLGDEFAGGAGSISEGCMRGRGEAWAGVESGRVGSGARGGAHSSREESTEAIAPFVDLLRRASTCRRVEPGLQRTGWLGRGLKGWVWVHLRLGGRPFDCRPLEVDDCRPLEVEAFRSSPLW